MSNSLRFRYSGPIWRFGRVVKGHWEAITEAPSEAKALNNLKFRAKKELKLDVTAKIELNPVCLKIIDKRPSRRFMF